jgi:hypothetical protein
MKGRIDFERGGCGCHDILLLELAGFAGSFWLVSRMLLGKNVMT